MKIKVYASFLGLMLFALAALAADETWQGNAAVSQRGELERDGYFAASNAFPPGTKIRVINLDNNRSAVVTIKQRLSGAANVFLLLSQAASTSLGMQPTDVIRIKTEVVGISTDLTGSVTDLVENRDVDTNPALGTPDERTTTVVEASPSPSPSPTPGPTTSPSPSPTPFVDATVKDDSTRVPEKERFALANSELQGDVSTRRSVSSGGGESAAEVPLREARIPIKDRAQAVVIARPRTEGASDRALATVLPETLPKEKGQTDVYASRKPDKEEVIAILIEPLDTKTRETGVLSDINRPALDRETIQLALNDPALLEMEKPFVWERRGLEPEGEDLALLDATLPAVGKRENAEVNSYLKTAQEEDRLALESHALPDLRVSEKPDVTALAKTDYEKEQTALESHKLPDVEGKERPDVTQRTDLDGRDQVTTDLALVPTDPHPPVKSTTDGQKTTTNGDTTARRDTSADFMKNFYYLQLGVFSNRETAEKIQRAHPAYPMMIVSGRAGSAAVYKVVVGPLKRDESGTALYLFKTHGYRDAFLRFVE